MVPDKFSPEDKDGQTLTAALHHFFARRRSLRQCAERKVNLSPDELGHYKYVVVKLQMAGYKLSPITWNETDPQSPTYPWPNQILVWVNSAIDELLGLSAKAESNAADSADVAKPDTVKVQPDPMAKTRKELQKQLRVLHPLLSQDRLREYRTEILTMIRENWDTPTRRIILELLEHTEELATYFQAVRTAIKLVDQAKGPGEGRRAKVDELLQARPREQTSWRNEETAVRVRAAGAYEN